MRSRSRMAAFLAGLALLGISCGDSLRGESPAPALAIVNQHRDSAIADLLFSKFAASGEFALVEREQLARVLAEQELSSLTREDNVRTGKLVGADALLFVEADASLLHLRLVETQHGAESVRISLAAAKRGAGSSKESVFLNRRQQRTTGQLPRCTAIRCTTTASSPAQTERSKRVHRSRRNSSAQPLKWSGTQRGNIGTGTAIPAG